MSAVRDTVDPIMREVRISLGTFDATIDGVMFNELAARLRSIAEDIDLILARAQKPDPQTSTGELPRIRFLAAADFAPSHFFFSTALPPIVVIAVLAPTVWATDGLRVAEELVVAAFLSAGALALAFVLQTRTVGATDAPTLSGGRFGFAVALVLAALTAAVTVLAVGIPPNAIILYILPFAVATASGLVLGALGVESANRKLVAALVNIDSETQKVRNRIATRDRRTSDEVTALLHGPVLGRLSACVMAINLRPRRPDGSNSTDDRAIVSRVLRHLDAAANDLGSLARN